jgi:ectoine hydroxylase-related dioxygenase (phytanoyl-CoA dioxygenase family)
MPLTERQARFFDLFGYLSFPGLFAAEAGTITEAFEQVWTDHGGGHNQRAHDHTQNSALLPFIDQHAFLCALLDDERVESIGSTLLGDDFNYMSSDGNYFVGDTVWHSDGYSRAPGYCSLKLAFYLDAVGRDSGCLRVVPGSHRKGDPYAEAVHETIATSGSNLTEEHWGIPSTDVPAVALETQPGDLVVFNHRLKHATFGGDTRRRMFTINLQQRFREEDEELLRECIGSLAGFWSETVYAPLMIETAGPTRMRHLEQRLAHQDHLPGLVAAARQNMSEPNRF